MAKDKEKWQFLHKVVWLTSSDADADTISWG